MLRFIRYGLTVALFASFLSVKAQYNEFGFMIGGSTYKGELSAHTFNTDFAHFAFGGFYRHNWDRRWSWKLELNFGKISGNDAFATTPFERDRNLSFESSIVELSPQVEFNFFPYETGHPDFPFTPYLFTGISVFKFNPMGYLGNELIELQPLGTEGQGYNGKKKYNRVAIAIPIGGGFKFNIGRFGIGLEVGARRSYSDYIDDVSTTYPDPAQLLAANGATAVIMSNRSFSANDTAFAQPLFNFKQRGNSEDKDWYVFGGVTLYFRLTSVLKDICRPFKLRRY
jgi:hypothetical protein